MSSGLFQIVEGEKAVIREGGVYKEVDLATRSDGGLYVKAKGGFVRLYANGDTSAGSKCTLDTITYADTLYKDRLGRMHVNDAPDHTALNDSKRFTLLGKD